MTIGSDEFNARIRDALLSDDLVVCVRGIVHAARDEVIRNALVHAMEQMGLIPLPTGETMEPKDVKVGVNDARSRWADGAPVEVDMVRVSLERLEIACRSTDLLDDEQRHTYCDIVMRALDELDAHRQRALRMWDTGCEIAGRRLHVDIGMPDGDVECDRRRADEVHDAIAYLSRAADDRNAAIESLPASMRHLGLKGAIESLIATRADQGALIAALERVDSTRYPARVRKLRRKLAQARAETLAAERRGVELEERAKMMNRQHLVDARGAVEKLSAERKVMVEQLRDAQLEIGRLKPAVASLAHDLAENKTPRLSAYGRGSQLREAQRDVVMETILTDRTKRLIEAAETIAVLADRGDKLVAESRLAFDPCAETRRVLNAADDWVGTSKAGFTAKSQELVTAVLALRDRAKLEGWTTPYGFAKPGQGEVGAIPHKWQIVVDDNDGQPHEVPDSDDARKIDQARANMPSSHPMGFATGGFIHEPRRKPWWRRIDGSKFDDPRAIHKRREFMGQGVRKGDLCIILTPADVPTVAEYEQIRELRARCEKAGAVVIDLRCDQAYVHLRNVEVEHTLDIRVRELAGVPFAQWESVVEWLRVHGETGHNKGSIVERLNRIIVAEYQNGFTRGKARAVRVVPETHPDGGFLVPNDITQKVAAQVFHDEAIKGRELIGTLRAALRQQTTHHRKQTKALLAKNKRLEARIDAGDRYVNVSCERAGDGTVHVSIDPHHAPKNPFTKAKVTRNDTHPPYDDQKCDYNPSGIEKAETLRVPDNPGPFSCAHDGCLAAPTWNLSDPSATPTKMRGVVTWFACDEHRDVLAKRVGSTHVRCEQRLPGGMPKACGVKVDIMVTPDQPPHGGKEFVIENVGDTTIKFTRERCFFSACTRSVIVRVDGPAQPTRYACSVHQGAVVRSTIGARVTRLPEPEPGHVAQTDAEGCEIRRTT